MCYSWAHEQCQRIATVLLCFCSRCLHNFTLFIIVGKTVVFTAVRIMRKRWQFQNKPKKGNFCRRRVQMGKNFNFSFIVARLSVLFSQWRLTRAHNLYFFARVFLFHSFHRLHFHYIYRCIINSPFHSIIVCRCKLRRE